MSPSTPTPTQSLEDSAKKQRRSARVASQSSSSMRMSSSRGTANSSMRMVDSRDDPSTRMTSQSSSWYATPSRNRTIPIKRQIKSQTISNSDSEEEDELITNARRKQKILKPSLIMEDETVGALPGREEEFSLIKEKLVEVLKSGQGCCIYISGVPGTGKTATLRQVIKSINSDSTHKSIKRGKSSSHSATCHDYLEINGMKLSDPSQAYSILWQKISGKNLSAGVSLKRLCKYFESSKKSTPRPTTIVLLDELDLLLKKKSSILYHFFEWTGWRTSKLVVVAIANTMDLPERFLPNRIASRMGTNRINFKPYSYPQLMTIISSKLAEQKSLFHPDAIEYCARKVSAVSGDARRAIALAKRAVDWVQRNSAVLSKSKQISIPAMEQAIQMTFAGNQTQLINDLSMQEKILLLSVVLTGRAESGSGNSSIIRFDKACETHWQLLRANGLPNISFQQLQSSVFRRLETLCLIKKVDSFYNLIPIAASIIRLCLPEEEVIIALRQVAILQKHLQT